MTLTITKNIMIFLQNNMEQIKITLLSIIMQKEFHIDSEIIYLMNLKLVDGCLLSEKELVIINIM